MCNVSYIGMPLCHINYSCHILCFLPSQSRSLDHQAVLIVCFWFVPLSYSPLFCLGVGLFAISNLSDTTRILHVIELLCEWRARRGIWPLVILVSWPFLSSGWPALALETVSQWQSGKSGWFLQTGSTLKSGQRQVSLQRRGKHGKKAAWRSKPHWGRIAHAATHGGGAQGRRDKHINALVADPVATVSKRETREEQSHKGA